MLLNRKIFLGAALPCLTALGVTGSPAESVNHGIMVNYNGQADLLLSLKIPPDYYPYQFKRTGLYDYLNHIDQYIVSNEHVSEDKREIRKHFPGKLRGLISKIREFGPSLWNSDLYDTGQVFRNEQFWTRRRTKLLFLEQFFSDDYKNLEEAYPILPSFRKVVVTNYRAARDPYTIFSEEIFKCFRGNGNGDSQCGEQDKKIYEEFKKYMESYDREDINSLYRYGKYIDFWNSIFKDEANRKKVEDWIKRERLFDMGGRDQDMAKKYQRHIFSRGEEDTLKGWDSNWKINYIRKVNGPSPRLVHHPALEQTTIPGSAPLAEGSQRDVVVFLYQFALQLKAYAEGSEFNTDFKDDYRKDKIQKALDNADSIANQISSRFKSIREYFKRIGVVDGSFDPDKGNWTNDKSKTFMVLTYPPSSFGAGESTIQSMSKFPFIYRDIGLKQPLPRDMSDRDDLGDELFSVDDNGWWWRVGNMDLDSRGLQEFRGTADTLLILSNPEDWVVFQDNSSSSMRAAGYLIKGNHSIDRRRINGVNYPVHYQKYHLWNEGLRSPIALNLLLDNLVDIFQRQYDYSFSHKADYSKAMDWGDYWKNF